MKEPIPHRLYDVDYSGRRIYHITMTTEGRHPLLGTLTGNPALPQGSPGAPAVVPSALGAEVLRCLHAIPTYHPHARLVAWQLMPDHLHFILFITNDGGPHLGRIILGFKQGCNKALRALTTAVSTAKEPAVGEAAVGEAAIISQPQQPSQPQQQLQQQPQQQPPRRPTTEERKHGQLWATSYYEVPLSGRDQLQHMIAYVHDNPRRLLLKRQHSTLFTPTPLTTAGIPFTAVGNSTLIDAPVRIDVRISRHYEGASLDAVVARFVTAARNGAVLISPFISPGEVAVHNILLNEGIPHIRLDGNGFSTYYKPPSRDCDLVACNSLLILAPWPHQPRAVHLGKSQFEALNRMAHLLANQHL